MKKVIVSLLLLFFVLPVVVIAQEEPIARLTTVDVNALPGRSTAYIKAANGQAIDKNADVQQPAFSTIKLWIAAAVMKGAEDGSIKLSDSHAVTANEKVGGTGFIAVGSSYTYDQLLEYMLTHSDNSATNILIDKAGGLNAINQFIQSSGYSGTTLQRYMTKTGPDNLTTAKDGVTFLENLYARKVVSSTSSDKIISLLDKRTLTKKDGIYIGANIGSYAGKSGVGPDTRNDIGTFVTTSGGRVFMAVLLTGLSDVSAGEKAITTLADRVATLAGGASSTATTVTPGVASDPSKTSWCIKVGNPTTPNPCLTIGGGGLLGDVLSWAVQITSKLTRGGDGYLNKIAEAITNNGYSSATCPGNCYANTYWCTYLIVDSYNLAGHKGLTRGAHAAVVTMRKWWYTEGIKNGYIYIDYPADNQSITQVKPGYAIFMETTAGVHTGGEHVNMVKSISLDERGNGEIVTYDSNSSSISHTITIRNYVTSNTPYPIRGFGGI